MRRFLALILRTDASPIRRSSRPARIAAGVAHAVLEANGRLGRRGFDRTSTGPRLRAGDVAASFGTSGASDIAQSLVRAAGLHRDISEVDWSWTGAIELPTPALLHSSLRRLLLDERRVVIEQFLEEERQRAGRRPMVALGDGRVEVRGCLADVAFVTKGSSEAGQLAVMVAMAPLVPEPELELYALSIPEAHRLLHLLEKALDAPDPFLRYGREV
jgi:hypothetical protein